MTSPSTPFDESVLREHAMKLAAAAEERRLRKTKAYQTYSEGCQDAVEDFAKVVLEAREVGIEWADIERFTKYTRQNLGQLLRQAKNGKRLK